MNFHRIISVLALFSISLSVLAAGEPLPTTLKPNPIPPYNEKGTAPQKIVIVTGARFSYRLVQKWIDDYNKIVPDVQIIIEARGSADPAKFDILAEVYQHEAEIRKTREY